MLRLAVSKLNTFIFEKMISFLRTIGVTFLLAFPALAEGEDKVTIKCSVVSIDTYAYYPLKATMRIDSGEILNEHYYLKIDVKSQDAHSIQVPVFLEMGYMFDQSASLKMELLRIDGDSGVKCNFPFVDYDYVFYDTNPDDFAEVEPNGSHFWLIPFHIIFPIQKHGDYLLKVYLANNQYAPLMQSTSISFSL